ncbi:uncharacterized protein TrAFT101_007006 [Trichoderma asperellum]|uniref:Zn(2)-C6 fungal-type domain-containing protein n=1 Tax=Trichoderma asperellum (strain ATCC 204424 / CBS 433.97 / NBRC 101777) TaxID=1042311 RepID=A0A2T3Z2D5_TRIA4|nr:hypothetical protein M441DRAFT_60192 [Trichoderma asperellum CBS 433.97]PTB38979.1 hypothetical protein M441DRAFT_60192 [Trichoderma asperellum CBS 433.97]UKZ92037.1 hypothetical protein TrAFT101_007006 [Trichoderma asperellum]
MSGFLPQKRLACIPCTKAKRGCSKQAPSCQRCLEKNVICRYPAPRIAPPYDLVFAANGAVSAVPASTSSTSERSLIPSPASHAGEEQQQQVHTQSRHPVTAEALQNPWFLSPSSWTVDHNTSAIPSQISFSDEALTYFIDLLHTWLKQWTNEGHCPFIHPQLWKLHLPDCIQDAFASLAAYHSRTPATEKMIMRIIESRVNNLVGGQNPSADGDFGVIMLDPACHLARTQALLVYKIIRLFDGDIRARAQAEKHIDTLSLWARQLWQSAGFALSSEQADASTDRGNSNGPVDTQLRTDGSITSTWQAWIFSESIRRTYLAATLTEAVYLTLKQSWAPCPGGIMFSGGAGLWEASSPLAWFNQYQNNLVNSVRCIDGNQLFTSARPSDVDEFCHATLIVSYGLERFERWCNESM